MPGQTRRERKRETTRRHIADTAARLFGDRGYENVSVSEIARTADVAEQTVYNYFRTKEQLVTDRRAEIQEELSRLVRERAPGVSPAAAVRRYVLDYVDDIRRIPPDVWRGDLAHLAAVSPTVRRLALDILAAQADAVAEAIVASGDVPPHVARLQGTALLGAYRLLIDEAGARTVAGQSQERIADELGPVVADLLDELDRWFSTPAARA
jgi:AcrR family transcriptional regulator